MSAIDFAINLGLLFIVMSAFMTLAYRLFYGVWPWHVDLDDEGGDE